MVIEIVLVSLKEVDLLVEACVRVIDQMVIVEILVIGGVVDLMHVSVMEFFLVVIHLV